MLCAGSRVGPYEILSPAGAGGMGEVWKARDPRLARTVAIKISDKQFSDRFEREARAIAALNHPHICAIYDVGPDYLVMEYVEGEPIKGPLPLAKALEYAKQILEALHAAHRAGIVHRDLKPANILVGKSGVKVLDFGLAKVQHAAAIAGDDRTEFSNAITAEGTIAGTLQYMAPEQLQAKEVDSRADIFAFGCVLYEMLTGKRAFDGGSTASVIAAILERPAPSVANVAPPALDRVLKRCLAKGPEERWQSALDVSTNLEWATQMETSAPVRPRRQWIPWALAAFGLVAGASALAFHYNQAPREAPLVRFSIAPPEGGSFAAIFGPYGSPPAFSRDGGRIAFAATDATGVRRIWVRPLDSFAAYSLAGTENAITPFWSPDSKSIGFFADGKLKRIDASGGPPFTLANAPYGRGGTWNQDDVILFAADTHSGLHRVTSSGGSPRPVTTPIAGSSHRWPWFLPDGKHFLYVDTLLNSGRATLRLGSLETSEARSLADVDSNAIWSEGYLLFLRGGTLMAQPFDTKRFAISGDASAIAQGVRHNSIIMLGAFGASATGFVAYQGDFNDLRLTRFDRSGKPLGTFGEGEQVTGVRLSPNGMKAAVTERGTGVPHLWIYDTLRGLPTRFTVDEASDIYPIWSADGRTIVFSSNRGGGLDLYREATDGSGHPQLVYADRHVKQATSLTPNGKYLLYWTSDPQTGLDMWVLPDPLTATPGKPFPFRQTRFNELGGQFSPDGRWVAYMADESGQFEIYVAPFPGPGQPTQVSTGGGFWAGWGRDGKEVLFSSYSSELMAAAAHVGPGGVFESGKPTPLVRLALIGPEFYDVSADGQRIVAVAPQRSQKEETLSVVQNWTAGLRK